MTKFEVGDKVRIKHNLEACEGAGNVGVMEAMNNACGTVKTINSIPLPGRYKIDLGEGCYVFSENMLELVERGYLPLEFRLHPNGNEALSKAMQERLVELGIRRVCHYGVGDFDKRWIGVFKGVEKLEYALSSIDPGEGLPILTLDDLYRLQPKAEELPKLEIAGRILELKDGRVVGSEFDASAHEFRTVLKGATTELNLGGKTLYPISFKIGCQTVTQADLVRALDWLNKVEGGA